MRWPAYFLLGYVMLGVQLGVGAVAPVRGVGPDLMLLVVVFVALNAPPAEAMLGGVLLGAMQDLVTLQPFGLFAFAYGGVGWLVGRSAEHVRRGHPLTHVAFALLGGGITGALLVAHDWFRPAGPAVVSAGGVVARAVRIGPRTALVSMLYTALLAPFVIGPLTRLYHLIGIDPPHRRRGGGR
jgi:rod shape-determining protein MreD